MLAKKFRLPVNTFPAKARIFYRGEHFTIKTSLNSLSYNRVGVIATKKTAAGAVERNRLRRKIFDLFRETIRPRFAKGTDLLVLIKPIKLDRDAEENLFKELNLAKSRLHRASSIKSGKD
ncbi:MAG: ribonuclease P protein component [Candidatus Colwellbacteria bacterium]